MGTDLLTAVFLVLVLIGMALPAVVRNRPAFVLAAALVVAMLAVHLLYLFLGFVPGLGLVLRIILGCGQILAAVLLVVAASGLGAGSLLREVLAAVRSIGSLLR